MKKKTPKTPKNKKTRNKAFQGDTQFDDILEHLADGVDVESEGIESESVIDETVTPTRVHVQAPRPESEEAEMTHKQRRQQSLRKLGMKLKESVEAGDTQLPGFNPERITLDINGNIKPGRVTLPVYYKAILSRCKNLINDYSVLPSLSATCPGMNQRIVRIRMAQVLAVLLTSTEFAGGRIGRLCQGSGITPVAFSELRSAFMLRFGFEISENTWYSAIHRLRVSGLLQTMAVNVPVEVENATGDKVTIVRSAASYKQFTERFFREFKVTRYNNVMSLIEAGVSKMKSHGYIFKWVNFSCLANSVRDRVQASFLNDLIEQVAPVSGFRNFSTVP